MTNVKAPTESSSANDELNWVRQQGYDLFRSVREETWGAQDAAIVVAGAAAGSALVTGAMQAASKGLLGGAESARTTDHIPLEITPINLLVDTGKDMLVADKGPERKLDDPAYVSDTARDLTRRTVQVAAALKDLGIDTVRNDMRTMQQIKNAVLKYLEDRRK